MLLEAKTFYKRVKDVDAGEIPDGVTKWFIFHGQTGRLFVCPTPLDRLHTGWFVVSNKHMPLYTFDDDGRIATFVDCSCGKNAYKNVKYDPSASVVGTGEKFLDEVSDVELFQDHYVVGNAYITLEEIDGDVYVFATQKDDEKKRQALIRFRKDLCRFVRCAGIADDYGIHLDDDALYWRKVPDIPQKIESSRRVKTLDRDSGVRLGMARGKDASVDIFICDGEGNPLDYLMNISIRGMTMYPFEAKHEFISSPVSGMTVLAHVRCPVDYKPIMMAGCPQG